jgi:hypothetical protein
MTKIKLEETIALNNFSSNDNNNFFQYLNTSETQKGNTNVKFLYSFEKFDRNDLNKISTLSYSTNCLTNSEKSLNNFFHKELNYNNNIEIERLRFSNRNINLKNEISIPNNSFENKGCYKNFSQNNSKNSINFISSNFKIKLEGIRNINFSLPFENINESSKEKYIKYNLKSDNINISNNFKLDLENKKKDRNLSNNDLIGRIKSNLELGKLIL